MVADHGASQQERYVNQGNPAYTRLVARRTAEQAIPFLLSQLQPGMRVLDAGCGPGSITIGLAEAVGPTGEVVGVDTDGEPLAIARELAAERGVSNLRFEEASIFALPFPDGSFDAAYAIALLFHLRDPVGALRELQRVLKPGGIVCISNNGSFNAVHPMSPRLERWQELSRRAWRAMGVEVGLGLRQRSLLLEAGFNDAETRATVDNFGNVARTRVFAELLVTRFRGPNEAGGVAVREGWATKEEVEAICTELLAWGERPDAFAYQVTCHSVARKPS